MPGVIPSAVQALPMWISVHRSTSIFHGLSAKKGQNSRYSASSSTSSIEQTCSLVAPTAQLTIWLSGAILPSPILTLNPQTAPLVGPSAPSTRGSLKLASGSSSRLDFSYTPDTPLALSPKGEGAGFFGLSFKPKILFDCRVMCYLGDNIFVQAFKLKSVF